MNLRDENLSLSKALETFVIPWSQRWGVAKIFTAQPAWRREMELPEGMSVTRKPLRSARVPVRGKRVYGASALVDAEWPADELHSARTPKLCVVLAGSVALQIADYLVHCKPGHGLLLPPGTPFPNGSQWHRDETQPHQDHCEILMLMPYQGGLISWISRNWHDRRGERHKAEEAASVPQSRVPFYLNRLVVEATETGLHHRLVRDGLLNIAIALLHRELQELPVTKTGEINFTDGSALIERKEYSIAQAQEYVHENLREPLSIDKVAHVICMSRTIFTEQFRAQTGKSFAEYVQDRRFEEAAKLLKDSDLTVKHVADFVGLKPGHMRTLFRQREGISPTTFRDRSRPRSD